MNSPNLTYEDGFLSEKECTDLLAYFSTKVPFMHSEHFLFNRECKSSVLYCWITDTGLPYIFGKSMTNELKPYPFSDFPEIDAIRKRVEEKTGRKFNSVLINRYDDGTTSLGAHADNDAWLGDSFIVPSVSIGAARFFDVTPKSASYRTKRDSSRKDVKEEKFRYVLKSGSLVVMGEGMQKDWYHAIPKQVKAIDDSGKRLKTDTGLRINLTFRDVKEDLAKFMQ